MKSLPKSIRIKLLESDPAPDLNKMVLFVQRYRVIQEYAGEESGTHVAGVASDKNGEDMASLVALVSDIAERQKSREEKLARNKMESTRKPSNKKCFVCKKTGHIAKDCWYNNQRQSQTTNSTNRCHECQGYGHYAKDCANCLNYQRAIR